MINLIVKTLYFLLISTVLDIANDISVLYLNECKKISLDDASIDAENPIFLRLPSNNKYGLKIM